MSHPSAVTTDNTVHPAVPGGLSADQQAAVDTITTTAYPDAGVGRADDHAGSR